MFACYTRFCFYFSSYSFYKLTHHYSTPGVMHATIKGKKKTKKRIILKIISNSALPFHIEFAKNKKKAKYLNSIWNMLKHVVGLIVFLLYSLTLILSCSSLSLFIQSTKVYWYVYMCIHVCICVSLLPVLKPWIFCFINYAKCQNILLHTLTLAYSFSYFLSLSYFLCALDDTTTYLNYIRPLLICCMLYYSPYFTVIESLILAESLTHTLL